MRKPAFRGFTVFVIIWLGQLVSQLGSSLTTFALGVWVYLQTGSVSQFAMVFLAGVIPSTLISPLAGAMVDRWNRRSVMIACDLALAVNTLALIWLFSTGRLEIWHTYVAVAIASIASAFQWPAYSTLVPLLVSKKNFGRANGMIQGAEALAQLIAPVVGGILVVTIQLRGVLLIDCATFLFALITLSVVHVPMATPATGGDAGKQALFREAVYGWSYIAARRGLLGLMVFFAISNLLAGVVEVLAQPLILSFASPTQLGRVLSIGGCGMLAGSVLMSVWGGPRRRVYGILGFHLVASLAFIAMGWRPSIPLVTISAFVVFLCMPIINGSNRALLNVKVEPGIQGRVFATSRMITSLTQPLGYVIAGPLADKVFGPLLVAGGALSQNVGAIIGVGPGRGIGLLFVVVGGLAIAVTGAGYLYRPFRQVEHDLPDIPDDELPAREEQQEAERALSVLVPCEPLEEPAGVNYRDQRNQSQ
jgi:DHA3 family macrolide efflux protein-like MFS transporter